MQLLLDRINARFSGRTAEALRLVLLEGFSQRAAAQQCGLDHAAVSRAVGKLMITTTCPTCGHKKKELDL